MTEFYVYLIVTFDYKPHITNRPRIPLCVHQLTAVATRHIYY